MIWSRTGGSGSGPLLVLLHGLGATADVFTGVERVLRDSRPGGWPGGWLSIDLPGHGRSHWEPPYTFERHVRAVGGLLPRDRDVVVLGHSMGGAVALGLADGRTPVPAAVVAFGVKVDWPEEHVAAAARMAARPASSFTTRAEAAERYLKLAGLTGLVSPDDPAVDAAVTETPDGWRVAQDPATFGVGVPDVAGALARAACPALLARCEHDAMVTEEQLRALVSEPVSLPGVGHNAHVEDPASVVDLVRRYA